MKKIVIFLGIALLLSSCVSAMSSMSAIPLHSIRVYDENAFLIVKPMLEDDFSKQKIDAEIPLSPSKLNMFGVFGVQMAKNLYKKLSLSFRFQDTSSGQQSFLLSDYVTDNADVTMYAYGFTIDQGSEYITVTILGETDWNSDNINDYIVSFRINQKALNYESNNQKARVALPTREYLLLIKNVNSIVYNADILLIHDYLKQSNGILSETYKNHESAQDSFFQDHGSISYEQGQEQIVFAPNTGEQQENKSKEKETQVKKTELTE